MQDVPDQLHSLRVHSVRWFGLQRISLHRISTLYEGEGAVRVIHRFPKLVHLHQPGEEGGRQRGRDETER